MTTTRAMRLNAASTGNCSTTQTTSPASTMTTMMPMMDNGPPESRASEHATTAAGAARTEPQRYRYRAAGGTTFSFTADLKGAIRITASSAAGIPAIDLFEFVDYWRCTPGRGRDEEKPGS